MGILGPPWAIRPCFSNLLLHGQRNGHGLLTPPYFPRSDSPPLRQLASSHVEARLYTLGLPCSLPSDPIRLVFVTITTGACPVVRLIPAVSPANFTGSSSLRSRIRILRPDQHRQRGTSPVITTRFPLLHPFDEHHTNRTRPQRPGTDTSSAV